MHSKLSELAAVAADLEAAEEALRLAAVELLAPTIGTGDRYVQAGERYAKARLKARLVLASESGFRRAGDSGAGK